MKRYIVLEEYEQLRVGQVITAKDLNYDYTLLDLLVVNNILKEDQLQ